MRKRSQVRNIIKAIQKYNEGQERKAKDTTVISEKKKILSGLYTHFTKAKPKPKKMWNNKKEMKAYKRKRKAELQGGIA